MIVNFPARKSLPPTNPTSHDLSAGNETIVNVVAEIREGFKQVIAAINNNELQARGRRSVFQIIPRLLTKVQAANYCGIGHESFAANCPVQPVRLRPGERGLRYDVHELDAWLDSLKENSTGLESENVNWLKRVG